MNKCILCEQIIKIQFSVSFIFSFEKLEKKLVCKECLNSFEKIDLTTACKGCSRPQVNKKYCSDCKKWMDLYPEINLKHTALYKYNTGAGEYMERFKFQGDVLLAEAFAEKIHEHLKQFENTHDIVPVPSSESSIKQRGFNQVEVLLQHAEITYQNVLTHIGKDKKQTSKSRQERIKTQQPFTLNENYEEHLNDMKPILLVDDVYTTGRTILHAQIVLNQLSLKKIQKNETKRKVRTIKSFSLFR